MQVKNLKKELSSDQAKAIEGLNITINSLKSAGYKDFDIEIQVLRKLIENIKR
jgi:hypothetical protein